MSLDIASVDASVIEAFGEDFVYTPDGGSPSTLSAYYQNPEVEADSGDATVMVRAPQILVKASDFLSSIGPADSFQRVADGITYQVRHVESDEGALWLIYLETQ